MIYMNLIISVLLAQAFQKKPIYQVLMFFSFAAPWVQT